MKTLRPAVPIAALAAIAVISPAGLAAAQTLPGGVLAGPLFPQPGSGSLYPGSGSLFPNSMPAQTGVPGLHRHQFNGGFILYERPEVIHDVVVVHDQPPEPSPPPPSPSQPRQRWVLGRSYGSLPDGCLKMLAASSAFFDCSGEWYRQVGTRRYIAVTAPL